jgi:hypothetical protein
MIIGIEGDATLRELGQCTDQGWLSWRRSLRLLSAWICRTSTRSCWTRSTIVSIAIPGSTVLSACIALH